MLDSPTRRVRSADGTELAVYEGGAGDSAPTLVAVHGYPDNHHVWDGVTPLLGERFRVVSYDVRGAGRSDKPTDRAAYRMPRLVDDLVAVVDAVSPHRPVHLLGHDWGSIQCWPALTDPRLRGRITGYTSVSGPSLEHAAVWLRDARRHPGTSLHQLADSYYVLLFQLPRIPESLVRSRLFDRLIALANPRSVRADYRGDADLTNGLQLYRANLFDALSGSTPARVDVPVQVLAPRDDSYLTVAMSTQAPAAFVTNLRTRVLAGGHWVVADRPDVIARCVSEFADHLDGAPETRALAVARGRRTGDFGSRLVVVTGAGRGIGRATALEFARHGADVVVVDIDDIAAEQTVRDVRALGCEAHAHHLDVSDADAWQSFADTVIAEHGVPDVIVNNAGIGMSGSFVDTSVADWQHILGINLWGVIHGCRLFAAAMLEQGEGGRIVNIASAAAYSPSLVYPAYATSKAAVLMLTECLRAELGRDGIGVTAICPGFVDSDISRSTIHVGVDAAEQIRRRDHAVASYARRNYTPERLAKHIVRAARRETPVATISVESKVFRALTRFAPPVARKIATVDLNSL